MKGPGKYDELCTHVREETKAKAAIIIVFEGEHGNGFSCQAQETWGFNINNLPEILEAIAQEIRRDRTQQS